MKPGGLFGLYDWCTTDKFDKNNAEHVAIRRGIEVGNSLPPTPHYSEVVKSLKRCGWEVQDVLRLLCMPLTLVCAR